MVTVRRITGIRIMDATTVGAIHITAAALKEFAITAVGTKPGFVADALRGFIDETDF